MSEETIEDIVAEIRHDIKLGNNYYAANLPDRIKSALDRDRTSRRSINIPIEIKPTSATLQALGAWISLAEWLIANAGKDALGQGIAKIVPLLRIRIDQSRAALSRPLRNCDVGTADEQDERFGRFCVEKRSGSCSGCPDAVGGLTVANGISECALVWAQMPYEAQEGAAK